MGHLLQLDLILVADRDNLVEFMEELLIFIEQNFILVLNGR